MFLHNIIVFFLSLALLPRSDAAYSFDELRREITKIDPLFHVPEGELENVLSSLREYNMIMLVTTNEERYNCLMCEQFDPIFVKIIQNVYKKHPELLKNTIFTRVEAAQHLPTLKSLGIKSVPQVWGFPDSRAVLGAEKYKDVKHLLEQRKAAILKGESFPSPDWYDLDNAGMEHYVFELSKGAQWNDVIEKLAGFIGNTLNTDVTDILKAGSDEESMWFTVGKWMVYAIVTFKFLQRVSTKSEIPIYADKNIYAYFCIVLIFVNLSGYNFTMQRKVPFISRRGENILWVAPEGNSQFGSEIVISIALQITFSAVLLSLIVLAKHSHGIARDLIVTIASLSLLMLLLFAAGIYHLKNGSYPFNYGNLF